MNRHNIFAAATGKITGSELFETLCSEGNLMIERIISAGESTPQGTWLEQERKEWVILIQGNATVIFGDGRVHNLTAGDYLFIPSGCRHRVHSTSAEPRCIWLAVHF